MVPCCAASGEGSLISRWRDWPPRECACFIVVVSLYVFPGRPGFFLGMACYGAFLAVRGSPVHVGWAPLARG